MKKKFKYLSAISTVVLSVAAVLYGWPCLAVFHQPKIPEGLKRLRKTK